MKLPYEFTAYVRFGDESGHATRTVLAESPEEAEQIASQPGFWNGEMVYKALCDIDAFTKIEEVSGPCWDIADDRYPKI